MAGEAEVKKKKRTYTLLRLISRLYLFSPFSSATFVLQLNHSPPGCEHLLSSFSIRLE